MKVRFLTGITEVARKTKLLIHERTVMYDSRILTIMQRIVENSEENLVMSILTLEYVKHYLLLLKDPKIIKF